MPRLAFNRKDWGRIGWKKGLLIRLLPSRPGIGFEVDEAHAAPSIHQTSNRKAALES
jgi:hypothetical protein